jgi:hydrogenase-4 component E
MDPDVLDNLTQAAIPGWDLLLVLFVAITVLICLAKQYRSMTALLSVQGVCLSILTFALGRFFKENHLMLAAGVNLLIKGGLIPYMLWRSLKRSGLELRKEEHFSNLQAGVWIGVIVMLAVFVTPTLVAAESVVSNRTLQFGIAGVFLGLWLMVHRNYLYSQVVGLLLMENSLYLTALALTLGMALVIELGILVDLFICIFVMGVLLERIRRLFDSTAIDQLKRLRG